MSTPSSVRWFEILMYIGLVLTSIPGFILGLAMPLLFLPGLALTVLRGIFVWFTAHKRAVWGKWLSVAFVLIGVVSAVSSLKDVFNGYVTGGILYVAIAGSFINVVALAFIFTPSASQWFRNASVPQP